MQSYERELYRLIITKMRYSTIETVVLLGGESVTQKAGDTYHFAREGLVGANWRMAMIEKNEWLKSDRWTTQEDTALLASWRYRGFERQSR